MGKGPHFQVRVFLFLYITCSLGIVITCFCVWLRKKRDSLCRLKITMRQYPINAFILGSLGQMAANRNGKLGSVAIFSCKCWQISLVTSGNRKEQHIQQIIMKKNIG
jgi:hypothetical protein